MADITAGSDLGVCGESWWSTFSRERERRMGGREGGKDEGRREGDV